MWKLYHDSLVNNYMSSIKISTIRGFGPSRLICTLVSVWLMSCVLVGTGCTTVNRVRADWHAYLGNNQYEKDHLQAALIEFEKASELAPQVAVLHSKRGMIYRRLGDFAKAIKCYIEAVRHDPQSFDDTISLAELYHFTDHIQGAIRAYLHAVELQPDNFDAQLNLGTCYQQEGDMAQAVERFQLAIDIDPDQAFAYANLGVALDAQEKYYEAIRAYKQALESDSHQPMVLVNLAQTYMHQNRLVIGQQALSQAIRMDAGLAPAHEALGYCFFRMNKTDKAEASYRQALTFDRNLPRALAGLGSINMLRYLDNANDVNSRDLAVEYWHRSLELDPTQTRIRKLLTKYQPKREDPVDAWLGSQTPQ